MLKLSSSTDSPTILRLQVECTRDESAPKSAEAPYVHELVKSGDLVWIPQGEQEVVFQNSQPAPTNTEIVLAKLRPGQIIDMELHAVKGVGKDHAKFNPVGELAINLIALMRL